MVWLPSRADMLVAVDGDDDDAGEGIGREDWKARRHPSLAVVS